jgi:hypothetical protein
MKKEYIERTIENFKQRGNVKVLARLQRRELGQKTTILLTRAILPSTTYIRRLWQVTCHRAPDRQLRHSLSLFLK